MIATEHVESIASDRRSSADDLLDAILNASREGVLLVDRMMRIVAANAAAREAFARGRGNIENRRLTEVVRDLELHDAFKQALEIGKTTGIRLELVDVETRNFDVHVSTIQVNGSSHAIGVFYDVTQIEKLERVRQEFLSNISHELRTPLTSILAFVETLEDGAIDDRANNRRFLGVIRRNAERMHALIADILELSLIESGMISIEKRQVRLSSLVDDIFASLATKAASRSIVLQNLVAKETAIFADPARLEQMLTNLVDNGIKFNRPEGTVTVAAARSGNFNLLTVTDTGEGILPEHLQRIFERFYRSDRGRTREVGGTGLGLAIVKHLARLHGGEVSVRSRLTEGTVFSIELPAQ